MWINEKIIEMLEEIEASQARRQLDGYQHVATQFDVQPAVQLGLAHNCCRPHYRTDRPHVRLTRDGRSVLELARRLRELDPRLTDPDAHLITESS